MSFPGLSRWGSSGLAAGRSSLFFAQLRFPRCRKPAAGPVQRFSRLENSRWGWRDGRSLLTAAARAVALAGNLGIKEINLEGEGLGKLFWDVSAAKRWPGSGCPSVQSCLVTCVRGQKSVRPFFKGVVFTRVFYLQVAEFIDERPDEVKLMEEFRTNAKWKLLGGETSPFHPLSLNISLLQTTTLQVKNNASFKKKIQTLKCCGEPY